MVRVRKVALMGFPGVGKSSLAYQFVNGSFEDEYCTTIENQLEKNINIGGRDFRLQLFDTMGVTELPNFPDEYYAMDGWVIVYSVCEPRSLEVVRQIYDRLITAGTQHPPVVLVGNKCDLESMRTVDHTTGAMLATECEAVHVEASAKLNKNVKEIFSTIVKEIEKSAGDPIAAKGECVIL